MQINEEDETIASNSGWETLVESKYMYIEKHELNIYESYCITNYNCNKILLAIWDVFWTLRLKREVGDSHQ